MCGKSGGFCRLFSFWWQSEDFWLPHRDRLLPPLSTHCSNMEDQLFSHEYGFSYDSKRRFASYWHQIREVLERDPKRVLEVGVGNGFVSNYLRSKRVMITTVDVEVALRPDVVADISKLPFPDSSFDMVTAYEVLEHMPFEKSLEGLSELRRVSSGLVLISLPDASHAFRFACTIPHVGYVQYVGTIPFLVPPIKPYAKSHVWELGIKDYSFSRFKDASTRMGLRLVKTYRVFENPYHRFLVFKK